MSRDELYLLDRAESELEAARAAAHPRAASAHFHLAGLMFDRFFRRKDAAGRPNLSLKFDATEPPHPSQPAAGLAAAAPSGPE